MSGLLTVLDHAVEVGWLTRDQAFAVLDKVTADEPTALAGYMVAPDGLGDLAIWRTEDELFPVIAITRFQLRDDPALWDVLVAAVERGQA